MIISWNYKPRTKNIQANITNVTTSNFKQSDNLWYFKAWDYINFSWWAWWVWFVNSISKDLSTIEYSAPWDRTWENKISLMNDEIESLINWCTKF